MTTDTTPRVEFGPIHEASDYHTTVEMFDGWCEVVFRTEGRKLYDIDLNVLPDCGGDLLTGWPCSCKGLGHRIVGMPYTELKKNLPKNTELGGSQSAGELEPLFERLLIAKGVDPYNAMLTARELLSKLVDAGERLASRQFFNGGAK